MAILFIMPFLLLDTSHSLAKAEKSYNPIEFWDRLLMDSNIGFHIKPL